MFPIDSYDGRYTLDFVKYELGEPKTDALTALADGNTFAAPLHATFRLKDGDEIREEDVYMGEIPLMTRDGAFVINGAERVIVSQLHRSPGICSEKAQHPNGQTLFSVRLIPDRGSWIEIQFDSSDLMWVYMDRRRRRRKFYATTFLRALGYGTDEEILKLFYTFQTLSLKKAPEAAKLEMLVMKDDLIDVESQAVLARRFDPITPALVEQISAAGFDKIDVVDVSVDEGVLIKTLREDAKSGIHSEEDALKDIYKRLRPGDPPVLGAHAPLFRHPFLGPRSEAPTGGPGGGPALLGSGHALSSGALLVRGTLSRLPSLGLGDQRGLFRHRHPPGGPGGGFGGISMGLHGGGPPLCPGSPGLSPGKGGDRPLLKGAWRAGGSPSGISAGGAAMPPILTSHMEGTT
ncbi:MAG: DNA-directed RNA polymerase subunit beta [Synergistetes bacterium ADurb.Bin520]|nr:MAG: DNA-directed RNA polymerase subunit beta [Synergistetes bacterium ADurb.Bin520]